ncbi:hypothetical protein Q4487_12325 [Cellulophaga sp. 3_MG-2023]|nr:hypothetical protein [Cellulophaga sp. 2_MG-2023]MDO6495567.1 hypothetical protein [Cellulophaga sp. 3_MG-2023]
MMYDSGLVLFTGSIHKMFNSLCNIKSPNYKKYSTSDHPDGFREIYKGYNGNQFNINNVLKIKEHLIELFDCSANELEFQNIEFGINTEPKFNPDIFIKGLMYQKGKMFEFRFDNSFAQVVHQRYFFKIYNKSKQYGMSKDTLRVELKIIKSEYLKEIGIKTFEDINEATLKKAIGLLLRRFKEVVYYDYTIDKKKCLKRNLKFLKSYSNTRFWIYDLKPQHRDRHKKRLEKIINENSLKLKSQINDEINKKCVINNRLLNSFKCVISNNSNIELLITHSKSNSNAFLSS